MTVNQIKDKRQDNQDKLPKNYVKNKDLLEEFRKWKESGTDRMPESLAIMVMKIADRLLYHRNFRGYPKELKEDMKSNGIYLVLKYAKSFDPNKSKNPFAYLTQIIKNAYIQVISAEYKNEAKAINYFLENTDNIDLADGYIELLNNNLESNKNSIKKKAIKNSKKLDEQQKNETLF